MSDKEYSKRLCDAKCSWGTRNFKQKINSSIDHGVYLKDKDHPLLNGNDHVPMMNLMQFHKCRSPINPINIAEEAAAKTNPALQAELEAKKAINEDGCPCIPVTMLAWLKAESGNCVGGAPAITNKCTNVCIWSGKITIEEDPNGQMGKDGENLIDIQMGEYYKCFKSFSNDIQLQAFNNMPSEMIYALVKNSVNESWPVTGYDLVSPQNAKKIVKLEKKPDGSLGFNLDWPPYGGYDPKTIKSVSNLKGKVPVSRDGGDGGYTMGLGQNEDGSYDNNSMRSIPKSAATVNTGTFDVDRYKQAVDIVTSDISDGEKVKKFESMGIKKNTAILLLKDYSDWKDRPEICGPDNIEEGANLVRDEEDGPIDMKYGVYGEAMAWHIADLDMVGGAGQMNTVFSWGRLKEADIITNFGQAKIN